MVLKNLSETVLKNKGRTAMNETTEDDDDDDDDGISSLNLAEKDELIGGLQQLYDSSDKAEQVRLLTIAPSNWGRKKVQRFFKTPERQARRSRELRVSGGFLAQPEDLRGNNPLDAVTAQAVIDFFEQDSISRVSPKKADVILVKKQPVAKRFMLLTIGEAFEVFKSDFSQYEIGRSQFYALRLRHVKPMSLHDTCCCVYHENFDLVLKVSKEISLDSRLIMWLLLQAWDHLEDGQLDRQTLFDQILCSPAADACYCRDCRTCGNQYPSDYLLPNFHGDTDEDIQWCLWKRTDNRVALQQIKGSVSLLLDEIDDQWDSYVTHHHCMKTQQLYISEIKKVKRDCFYLHIVSLLRLIGIRPECNCSCANGLCAKFCINITARGTVSTLRQTTSDYFHGPCGNGGSAEELRNNKRLSRACNNELITEFPKK